MRLKFLLRALHDQLVCYWKRRLWPSSRCRFRSTHGLPDGSGEIVNPRNRGIELHFPIIIAGHSHIEALGKVPLHLGDAPPTLAPLLLQEFASLTGAWPRADTYWDDLCSVAPGRLVGISWGGAEYVGLFFFAQLPYFDVLLPDYEDEKIDESRLIVPYRMAREVFQSSMPTLDALVVKLKSIEGCVPFLIGAPPPRGDHDHVQAMFEQKHEWFEQLANALNTHQKSLGVRPAFLSISNMKLNPPRLRYKLWLVSQMLQQEIAKAQGIPFVSSPPETLDADGYLRPEFAKDFTHANQAYGGIMLRHIKSQLGKQHASV